MNIAKNMEVIFFAAIALASATGFASAKGGVTAAQRAPAAITADAPVGPMQVVTISAKRLSAAEKAALPQ